MISLNNKCVNVRELMSEVIVSVGTTLTFWARQLLPLSKAQRLLSFLCRQSSQLYLPFYGTWNKGGVRDSLSTILLNDLGAAGLHSEGLDSSVFITNLLMKADRTNGES